MGFINKHCIQSIYPNHPSKLIGRSGIVAAPRRRTSSGACCPPGRRTNRWRPGSHHPYELFLQLEGIEHRTTKVRRPQSNGFIERLHKTLLDEFFRIAGRTKWYESVEEMQKDLDTYLIHYNTKEAAAPGPHDGRKNAADDVQARPSQVETGGRRCDETGYLNETPARGGCQVITVTVHVGANL